MTAVAAAKAWVRNPRGKRSDMWKPQKELQAPLNAAMTPVRVRGGCRGNPRTNCPTKRTDISPVRWLNVCGKSSSPQQDAIDVKREL